MVMICKTRNNRLSQSPYSPKRVTKRKYPREKKEAWQTDTPMLAVKPSGLEFAHNEKEHPNLDFQRGDIVRLESVAQDGCERSFLKVLKDIDWRNWPAGELIKLIMLALKAGAHLAARQIASESLKRHPDNSDIQKYARGLAAPTVVSRDLPPNPTLKANREWLKTHSAAYRGQWVAIRNGELLGTAGSMKELTTQIPDRENILFTKVR